MVYGSKAKAGAREQPITEHLAEFLGGYIESADEKQEWLFPAKQSATDQGIAITRTLLSLNALHRSR